MKLNILLFTLIVFSHIISAQYADPNIPKPTSGYGSDGSHSVGVISFRNPNFLTKDIEIYYPSDVQTQVPTIFYSHAYGGNLSANILGMLQYVARKGYAIVYVPYQTTMVTVNERYTNLTEGFLKAVRDYTGIIDTTRVGFMGHSFGGGASYSIAYKFFKQNGWGANGRFVYALAPWYTYNLTQEELTNFPSDTKILTEVFDDDTTNDHRMAIDIFNNIGVDASEKDFILLRSDTIAGHIYASEHNVPNTSSAFDALDYYAYYRFIDALCDYTFNKNPEAKKVALGNGSNEQITMPGGLKSLIQTDYPSTSYPQSKYIFSCNSEENPRNAFCATTAVENKLYEHKQQLTVMPNSTGNGLKITLPECNTSDLMSIYSAFGEKMYSVRISGGSDLEIDIDGLRPGIYLVQYNKFSAKFLCK